MAYVGKAPATSVLTSADIQDGVISTNKIANDAVVSSKISDGTVTNSDLQYSSITINGSPVSLGGSVTIGETKPDNNFYFS
jgi:osmotically-inducible protein OsmY